MDDISPPWKRAIGLVGGGRVVSIAQQWTGLALFVSYFVIPDDGVCLPREPAVRCGMDSYQIDVVDNGAIVKVFLLEGAFPWNTPKRILESAGGFWESYGMYVSMFVYILAVE